jgi:hypothetical protein
MAQQFWEVIYHALHVSGIDTTRYGSQSFRRGGNC